MWNLSSLVPAGMRPWLLAISIVLFLTVGYFMKQLVAPVQPRPLCLQFAWSNTRASEILRKWTEAENGSVRRVRLNLAFDFVFILIYVSGLALACGMAANALDAARWPGGGGMGGVFARAIIIAGLLDALENGAQLLMLAGHKTQPWPALASVCASIKFSLFAITFLYALYGGAAFVCHYLDSEIGAPRRFFELCSTREIRED